MSEEGLRPSNICMEIAVFLVNYCDSLQVKKFISTFLSSREIQSPCFLDEVSEHQKFNTFER